MCAVCHSEGRGRRAESRIQTSKHLREDIHSLSHSPKSMILSLGNSSKTGKKYPRVTTFSVITQHDNLEIT